MIPVMTRGMNTNSKGQIILTTTTKTSVMLTTTGPPGENRKTKTTDDQDRPRGLGQNSIFTFGLMLLGCVCVGNQTYTE